MLTIGGVETVEPTPDILAWIDENIPLASIVRWTYRAYPGARLGHIAWPTGHYPAPSIQLNQLFWYPGASRWSFIHVLASWTQLKRIRALAFGEDGNSNSPLAMVMQTTGLPSPHSIETDLYLMPPHPLARFDRGDQDRREPAETDDDLYLLTLVDGRYWWQYRACPDFAIGESTTWSGMIGKCAEALELEIDVGAIPGSYGKPDRSLNLQWEAVPPVLDAICTNVGLRIVRDLDGTVHAMDNATSSARLTANLNDFRDYRRAGGAWFEYGLPDEPSGDE